MTDEQIKGNKLIVYFVAAGSQDKEAEKYYKNEIAEGFPDFTGLKYHKSWNWLMPVVRGLVEIAIHENGWEAFESQYYDSLLDTVPTAVIEDVFKVVVEFIEWHNKINKMAKTEKEYLELNADYCLFCNSYDITGGDSEFSDISAYRNVSCNKCGKTWTEEFTMTGVTDLK